MIKKHIYLLISILSGITFITLLVAIFANLVIIPNYIFFSVLFVLSNTFLLSLISVIKQEKSYVLSIITFITTNLIISGLFILLRYVFKESFEEYILGILLYALLNGVTFVVSMIASLTTKNSKTIFLDWTSILIYLILIAISLLAQYVANIGVGIDQTINIDAYQHLTGIKEIFLNNNIVFQLSDASRTFTLTTYLPIFHYIFGLPIHLGGAFDYIQSYRIIEVSFTIFASLLLYSGIYKITGSKLIAVTGSILSTMAFESYGAYTSFYLLPQTFTTLLGISTLFYLLTTRRISLPLTLSVVPILILNHFFVGSIITFLFVLTILYLHFDKQLSLIITLSMIILIIVVAVSDIVSLNILKTVGDIYPDFLQRESELVQLGSIDFLNSLFRSFGPISIVLTLLVPLSALSKDKYIKLFGLLFLIVAVLITIKFPYSNKLLQITHYIGVIFIAYQFFKFELQKSIIALSLLFVILTGLIFNLSITTSKFIEIFGNKGSIILGNFERDIAKEINAAVNKSDYILISDPLTMHLIEPFILGKTTGGIFTDKNIRVQIWRIFNTNITDKEALKVEKSKLQALIPNKRLVYLSTLRTELWAKNNQEFIEGYGNQVWKIPQITIKSNLYLD